MMAESGLTQHVIMDCDNMVENVGTAPALGPALPCLSMPAGQVSSQPQLRSPVLVTPPRFPESETAEDLNSETEEAAKGMDFMQFGQWLVEHQAQTALLQNFRKMIETSRPGQDSGVAGSEGMDLHAGPSGQGTWFPLTKLGPEDDVEAFLKTFERTAEMAKWPKEQWSFILGPYLTGEAQTALQALPKGEAADYDKLKAAILDWYEITPETYRQKFRTLQYHPSMRP